MRRKHCFRCHGSVGLIGSLLRRSECDRCRAGDLFLVYRLRFGKGRYPVLIGERVTVESDGIHWMVEAEGLDFKAVEDTLGGALKRLEMEVRLRDNPPMWKEWGVKEKKHPNCANLRR